MRVKAKAVRCSSKGIDLGRTILGSLHQDRSCLPEAKVIDSVNAPPKAFTLSPGKERAMAAKDEV